MVTQAVLLRQGTRKGLEIGIARSSGWVWNAKGFSTWFNQLYERIFVVEITLRLHHGQVSRKGRRT